MKTYMLFECSKTNRLIISTYRPNYRVRTVRKVEAQSFKEAKLMLGFK